MRPLTCRRRWQHCPVPRVGVAWVSAAVEHAGAGQDPPHDEEEGDQEHQQQPSVQPVLHSVLSIYLSIYLSIQTVLHPTLHWQMDILLYTLHTLYSVLQ